MSLSRPRPSIGWVCGYVPEELLLAAGCQPVRLSGTGQPVSEADAYLHQNLCPYVRSVLDKALETDVELDGMVFVNSCDAMKRLHDVWRLYIGTDFNFILDMPKSASQDSIAYYVIELRRLIEGLETSFETRIDEERLREAIRTTNHTRRLMGRLYEWRRQPHPPLTGAEALDIMIRATQENLEDYHRWLEDYLDDLDSQPDQGKADGSPRLIMAGSIIDQPQTIGLIEEAGGLVVVEDLCTGHRHFQGLVSEEGDPLEAIARRYLERAPCSRMIDTGKRLEYMSQLAEDYRVDGIIYHALKFCDQYQYDLPLITEEASEAGTPLLYLETDYTQGSIGQVKTRVQAFLEVISE
jgi:benzoyl-CoA reductase/2-hydroxyglutaryl-CoA dehydratase subunit BcrC/BadD/HgdB